MNSKDKGNEFERAIAKKLSWWISNGSRGDLFWRTQNSGGRFTTATKQNNLLLSNQAGDISSTNSMSEPFIKYFVVECKFYKQLDFFNIVKNVGNIYIFWNKLCRSCDVINKNPILICKQNHMPILLCMNNKGKNLFEKLYNICFICSFPKIDMFVYLFDEIIKLNPDILMNHLCDMFPKIRV